MRAAALVALAFIGLSVVPVVHADVELSASACGPPCGPIPVIITILLEKSKGLTFDENNVFETKGKVQYYFDIDQNGYAYDPAEEMKITTKINKQPPWVKTTVTPTEYDVPLQTWECPTCVQTEGSDPQQQMFMWESDIAVKVEKLRDPTPEELKKWTKSDGTYRASFSAISNDSMVGTDPTGRPAGLMEGYGIKELRFLSSAETAASASNDVNAGGEAPGLSVVMIAGIVGLAAFVVLRRRQ